MSPPHPIAASTYHEVNDHMPESIGSSDQIDDWLSTLGGEGVEIVDSASHVKVADKSAPRLVATKSASELTPNAAP